MDGGDYLARMTTIAFAGAGAAAAVHALAAGAAGLTPVAVASRRWDRAVERATQMGARPVTYAELPAGADVVVVCTPPGRHAHDAIQALQGGAAALIEKPLATTLADADRLVEVAARSGGRIGYAENLAHAPVLAAALTNRPRLGTLGHLDARVVQPPPPWGGYLTEEWGGGVLFDVGPHPLALALLVARPARPVEVVATLGGSADHPVDEHAELTLTFDSGLAASILVSWRSTGPVTWDLQAAGRAGALRVELAPDVVLEVDGEPMPVPAPDGTLPDPRLDSMGYLAQMAAFAADVGAGQEPVMGAGFGREVLEIICAAYSSAGDGGRARPLPFSGPRDRTPLQLWRG
jgi:predicted dehydrogenase